MSDPVQNIRHFRHLPPLGQRRPVDHEDRQAKRPCRRDLGVGAAATGVLRNDEVDPFSLHKRAVPGFGEWPSIDNDAVIRERWWVLWRIDEAQKVEMPRVGGEVGQEHPTYRKQHATAGPAERSDRCGDVGDALPIVARNRRPWRTRQRQKRDACGIRGGHGMGAHRGCKGVRCVDQMRDPLGPQKCGQSFRPAEAAHPLRQRLAPGPLDPACERHHSVDTRIGHSARKRRGLGRASEDQEVWRHD